MTPKMYLQVLLKTLRAKHAGFFLAFCLSVPTVERSLKNHEFHTQIGWSIQFGPIPID